MIRPSRPVWALSRLRGTFPGNVQSAVMQPTTGAIAAIGVAPGQGFAVMPGVGSIGVDGQATRRRDVGVIGGRDNDLDGAAMKFQPDARPGTPGVIKSGSGLRPMGVGYTNYKTLVRYGGTSGWSALAAPPRMLWSNNFEGDGRVLAATATNIYELGITTYNTFTVTSVSSTLTSPTYGADRTEQSDPDHFVFTNYGKVVLGTNKFVGSLYAQTDNGATFAAVAGSPAAGCIVTWKNFVICGNVGTYGAVTGTQDMVAWSALSDYTSWVPSSATQAGYQRLLDIPGRIVAMVPIGDALAIFKADCIYLCRYVGPPILFSFELLDGERGCNASPGYPPPIADIGKALLVMGRDDVYAFDGASLRSISLDRVRLYMLNLRSSAGGILPGTHITHDPFNGEVFFHNYNLSYSYRYDDWGALPTQWNAAAVTAANYAGIWSVDYGVGRGLINNAATLVGKADGLIYNYWGSFYGQVGQTFTYEDMVMTFGPFGANDFASTLRRVFCVFNPLGEPTGTPTLDYSRKITLGATAVADGSGTWDSGKMCFDVLKNAYWHVPTLTFPSTGDVALMHVEVDVVNDGKRTESKLYPL